MKVEMKVKAKKLAGGKRGNIVYKTGKVIAIYPHLVLVDFGKYREAFNEADMATGEVQKV